MPAYNGEFEDVIRPFVDAMRYKLSANSHKKRNWKDNTALEMLALLKQEVEELEEAIKRGNTIEIMLEGADVANFAMFIVNLAIAAANEGKGSHV